MKKILIADDEFDILDVVQFRLISLGYEVITAVDGKEALERIKEAKPDLVLLDYSMPFINGDEVCRQIKESPEYKHIAVIIMTASAKIVRDEHIQAIGANDKILKPFEPAVLLEKVKKLIG